MKIYWTILVLLILSFSCQDATENTTSNEAPLATETTDVAAQPATEEQDNQTYMVKLKEGLAQKDATINDEVVFVAKAGELMLYNAYAQTVWLADGRNAYIPKEDLEKVDTPYFKLNFSKMDFDLKENDELLVASKANNVNYSTLVKNILAKDGKSLTQLFDNRDKYDGAAGESYINYFWAMLNHWSDDELSAYLKGLPRDTKSDFQDYIMEEFVTSPIQDPLSYYEQYYPKTLAVMNEE